MIASIVEEGLLGWVLFAIQLSATCGQADGLVDDPEETISRLKHTRYHPYFYMFKQLFYGHSNREGRRHVCAPNVRKTSSRQHPLLNVNDCFGRQPRGTS